MPMIKFVIVFFSITLAIFMNSSGNLDYSLVEIAADVRQRVRSCGPSPRVPCNKADAVRSARLNGKKVPMIKFVIVFFSITLAIFMNSSGNLDYSLVEVVADARQNGCSCGLQCKSIVTKQMR